MKKFYILFLLAIAMQVSAFAQTTLELSTRLTEDYPLEMPTLRAYPVYLNAEVEEPDSVTEVTLTINGEEFPAEIETGFYYYLWEPSSYGNHEIVMTAKTAQGEETTLTRNITVTNSVNSQVVRS